MKLFLAYSFTGTDKNNLKTKIQLISQKLSLIGHTTFCFYRDIQNWGNIAIPRNDIIPIALHNLDQCDAVFALIDSDSKSTGVGIEIGYAKGKNKKLYLAKKIDVESDYLVSVSDKILEFDTIQSLEKSLPDFFN